MERGEFRLYTFDLLLEPWIPVRLLNGERSALGIRDTLRRAHQIRGIEDASPLVTAALHRLLLAILHRSLDGPDDIDELSDLWKGGSFPPQVDAYLDRWRERFDLFHPEKPFWQVVDRALELPDRAWAVLAAERNTDNNKVLFDHLMVDDPPPIKPAEAARLLIAHQTFAVSAGKSPFAGVYTSTAPVAAGAMAIVLGGNLFETLCTNLPDYPAERRAIDTPIWEQDPVPLDALRPGPGRRPRGITDTYTWLSRAVHFRPEESEGGVQLRWLAYASGIRPLEPEVVQPDPLCAYRWVEPKGQPARYRLVGFDVSRGLWRDLLALVPYSKLKTRDIPPACVERAWRLRQEGLAEGPIHLLVLGQANEQAKIEGWYQEYYRLPLSLLENPSAYEVAQSSLEFCDQVDRALRSAAWSLATGLLTVGERKPDRKDVDNLVATLPLSPDYWSKLAQSFPELLSRLGSEPALGETRIWWRDRALSLAQEVWDRSKQSVGLSARALRAIERADRAWMFAKSKLMDTAAPSAPPPPHLVPSETRGGQL
jgi:CRISPR system Cascade subunit CasA